MQILQLTYKPAYPPVDGGCIAMQKICGSFLRLRHDVDVLTMSTFKHPYRPNAFPSHEGLTVYPVNVNVQVRLVDAFRNLLTSRSYIMARFDSEQVRKALQERLTQEYDLIWIESIFWLPYLDLLREAGVPLALRSHNIEHHIWRELAFKTTFPGSVYFRLLSRRLRNEETAMWHGVDQIYSISPVDSSFIAQHTAAEVIDLPMSMAAQPMSDTNPKPFCCHYLGAMDWIPNQEGMRWFLEEVWPAIHRSEPAAEFHLAGRGMPPEFTNWKAKGVSVHQTIDQAGAFRKEYGILIVPLFSGSGLRIKILEALNEGVPVLATSKAVEGLPDIGSSGIMVSDQPLEWRKMLSGIWHRPVEGRQKAEQGRSYIQHHFGETMLDQKLAGRLRRAHKP